MSDSRGDSILVLDLHARDDGFVGDASIGAIGARLQAEGYRVELLRSVRDADPSGPEAWLRRVSEQVSNRAADLVVLVRAWDRGVVDGIRTALRPGARLIRLGGGVAAAIDNAFDHVVDEPGLFALARGEMPEVKAMWRPTNARELRSLPRAPEPGTAMAALSLDAGPSGRRPTISGPASGCPFLLDVRKSPIFARAGLDATQIQTKGCSFCLDNSGAYVVPAEQDVVDAWLGQWRSLRASQPALREVVLTDERPHPYLPAFFAALEREPSLAGIELMIKSRVDWLLEFADDAMARALVSAERSGSVLHVYLVGFENFDAFHLELFNKGVTAADNARAVDKLHELERRHPRAFEFRKYRAHGIVLFTPWTSPESLLENARWMRAVKFHELRSEALRTRLRLYPRTPLHALAETDGLLAADFGERGDRAIEQGYDASTPWRFLDPRTEAIQQAVTSLSRVNRTSDEASVLEIATHFVLRWPALANVPSDAWLPLRYATGVSGPFAHREGDAIGPIAAGFDPEIEAIALGLKRASLKEGVRREDVAGLVRAYRAMGLCADVVGVHGFDVTSGAHSDGAGFATVAIAGTEADLGEVLRLQRAHAEGTRAPVDAMGALMGYPACCVAAFHSQSDRGDNLDNERQTFLRAPAERLDPLIFRLSRARLVSHHLCTPSCAQSVAFAGAVLARIDALEPSSAEWLRRTLSRPHLVLDYDHRLELDGAWDGDTFRVDRIDVLDVRHHLGFSTGDVTRIAVARDGVRFTLRDATTRFVAAVRPVLATPGQPLSTSALAAMAPVTVPRERMSPRIPLVPRLPSAIRVGAAARAHRVAAIRSFDDHHEVVLTCGDARVRLEVRAYDRSREASLRMEPWAIDVEAAAALTDDDRAAVSVFARALVAASRLAQR